MRIRLLFTTALFAAAFVVMMLPAAASAAPPAPTCGPYVTLTPNFGQPGDVISVNLFQFPADDNVSVIARVAGNPVVGTGKTDEYGHANVMVTVPSFDGDRVAFFVQASPCYAAGAYFERRTVVPTPTRTPAPVTQTPATPTTPATTVTQPPVVTITPQPPIAGGDGLSATNFVSGGMNLAIVGLALVIFCASFALWGSTRRLQAERSEKQE